MEEIELIPNHEDCSTYSNFNKIRQEKLKINAYIDFAKQIVLGNVEITFRILDITEKRVILDAKNITITSVKEKTSGNKLNFYVYDENLDKDALGTPLVILLGDVIPITDSIFELIIEFSTTENSQAVQWLVPEQTLNKSYPFMFTQCEAILARQLLPCQDTPSSKVIVEANLTVKKPLRALYSGIEQKCYESGDDLITYEYLQSIPVPTYLIAIACGELEYRKISERCGVFTELGLCKKAVWEFQETEVFLKAAESYLTPYAWGVYNILVLPQAFPYGGMENPCLTFVTPALLAGDRSMTNVIAHEISHSWTGNLVTNKNWTNFWMNEGFTTFMERKICELIHGEEMSNLEACVGKDELKYAISTFGDEHSFSSLTPDLKNIDPDDAFSTVPYEKGSTFLYYLETLIGKENFQKIFQIYIKKYEFKSISHEDFRETFESEVRSLISNADDNIINKIDWESWITKPGSPLMNFEFKSKWVNEAVELANQFLELKNGESSSQIFANWHTNVKLVFLEYLKDRIDLINESVYLNLRDVLSLHESYNAETQHVWYQIALKTKHEDVIPHVKKFLLSHGRMKYIRPVYYAWFAFNREDALDFFDKNKNIYHHVASRLIQKKFGELNA